MSARVIIVEDQTMFLQLLSGMLRSLPDLDLISTATTVAKGCAAVRSLNHLDLLILDLDLPDGDGTEVLRSAVAVHPDVECIILSGHASQFVSPPELRRSIRAVVDKTQAYDHLLLALGETRAAAPVAVQRTSCNDPNTRLTPRQMEIFRLIGRGMSNKGIADELHIAVSTVETHRKSIANQLNSRGPELVRYASAFNMTSLESY